MTDDERIGRAVRAELARGLVSAREMNRRMGWSPSYLHVRLTGQVPFRASELQAIAENLGVPVSRLYAPPLDEAPAAAASAG